MNATREALLTYDEVKVSGPHTQDFGVADRQGAENRVRRIRLPPHVHDAD